MPDAYKKAPKELGRTADMVFTIYVEPIKVTLKREAYDPNREIDADYPTDVQVSEYIARYIRDVHGDDGTAWADNWQMMEGLEVSAVKVEAAQ